MPVEILCTNVVCNEVLPSIERDTEDHEKAYYMKLGLSQLNVRSIETTTTN